MISDLDECQYVNGGCAHICVNQWGSYQCQCKDKYLLANNSHDCYGNYAILSYILIAIINVINEIYMPLSLSF